MRWIDIVKKDVLVVLRDVKALIFILIMPIVLIVILSFALSGVFSSDGFSLEQIHIAVVDDASKDDGDALAQQLAPYTDAPVDISAMSIFSVLDSKEVGAFLSYEKTDAETAQGLLDAGEVDAVVTVPKGYTAQVVGAMLGSGAPARISVMGAKGKEMTSGIVANIVRAYADTVSSISADISVLVRTALENGVIERVDIGAYVQNVSQAAAAQSVDIVPQGVAARKVINSFYYYSIAITCMFILFSAGQGSTFLYTESEEKTLARLMAAGVSGRKLLLGKSAAVFCLCVIQLILLFAFSTLAFGIDWGNPFAFVGTSLCVAASVTGLGVLLMVLVYRAGNPKIGSMFQSVAVQILALFGGSYVPLSVLPKFFSTAALFTPNGLAVKAYTENVMGAPFLEVLPYLLGSIVLGVLLFAVGALLFHSSRKAGGSSAASAREGRA